MADDRHYIPGSWYRLDERTGFKVRAEKTRKEWTGRIVRDQSWEARQPQDFVRGVRDDQTVPEPRPRQPNVFVGNGAYFRITNVGGGQPIGSDFNPDFGPDFGPLRASTLNTCIFVNRYDLSPNQVPPPGYIPGSNSGSFRVYYQYPNDPSSYPASNGSQGEGTY